MPLIWQSHAEEILIDIFMLNSGKYQNIGGPTSPQDAEFNIAAKTFAHKYASLNHRNCFCRAGIYNFNIA